MLKLECFNHCKIFLNETLFIIFNQRRHDIGPNDYQENNIFPKGPEHKRALEIKTLNSAKCHSARWVLLIVILWCLMLMSVILLSVILQSVIQPSGTLLNIVPTKFYSGRCHYVECYSIERHYALCWVSICSAALSRVSLTKCHSAICHSAECHSAECHSA